MFHTFSVCKYLPWSRSCLSFSGPVWRPQCVRGPQGRAGPRRCAERRHAARAAPGRAPAQSAPRSGARLAPKVSPARGHRPRPDALPSFCVSEPPPAPTTPRAHVTRQGGESAAAAATAVPRPDLPLPPARAAPPPGGGEPIRAHAPWPRPGALLGARPSRRPPARPSVRQAGSRSERP